MNFLILSSLLAAVQSFAHALPASALSGAGFRFYDLNTLLAGPCDLETGPDGAIWVQNQLVDKLARIDPTTGEVTEYDIPTTNPLISSVPILEEILDRTVLPCVVRTGADGLLYAGNGRRNQLVQMNVYTKEIKVFTPPGSTELGNLQPFNDMYTSPTGMYFTMTTANTLNYFDYANQSFTSYEVPTPLSDPLGVYYASDDNIYVAETLSNKIARFNTQTKEFTEYVIPEPLAAPAVIRAESTDGRIWFTCLLGSSLGSIDVNTGEIRIYPVPTPLSVPTEDTIDSEDRVWYSTIAKNSIGYIDTHTDEFTEIPIPPGNILTALGVPAINIPIHYDKGTNSIYFAQDLENRVGRYQL